MQSKPLSPDEIGRVLNSGSKLKIYLDTNVIIAYLDKSHRFNYEASVIIDPLRGKDCWFFVHLFVLGEFIDIWRKTKKVSVKEAIEKLVKFLESTENWLWGGESLTTHAILNRYNTYSTKRNLLKAHFNDFIILTDAINIKNIKILTCDRGMYEAGESTFGKNIYYLPFDTGKGPSDLSRFIEDMEGIIK